MRLFREFVFPTLVLCAFVANAAPETSAPKPRPPSDDESRVAPPPERIETIQWAPPEGDPELPLPPPRPVFKSRSPWSFAATAGGLSGQMLTKGETENVGLLGATAAWRDAAEREWDFNLEVSTRNWVRAGAGRRFALPVDWAYEPYWKLGVAQTVEMSRLLVAFVDLERVKAVGAVGFADLLEQDRRWNVEAGLGVGLLGISLTIQGGYAIEW